MWGYLTNIQLTIQHLPNSWKFDNWFVIYAIIRRTHTGKTKPQFGVSNKELANLDLAWLFSFVLAIQISRLSKLSLPSPQDKSKNTVSQTKKLSNPKNSTDTVCLLSPFPMSYLFVYLVSLISLVLFHLSISINPAG